MPCQTLSELTDKSKGDALSKGVTIVQTLWFIMQCIARRIKHLPITSLEVMTLAYTMMTIAMYATWWHKPLNIGCPIRVPGSAANKVEADPESIWDRSFGYVAGLQDGSVTLSQETRVPTFWSNDEGGNGDFVIADIIVLVVAMAFGAVHCIAWFYAFPSHIEQLIWRASAISIVVIPLVMAIGIVVFRIISGTLRHTLLIVFYVPCAVVYIAARLILLVLSFTTLRSLPFSAYQTVEWTTFIPHV